MSLSDLEHSVTQGYRQALEAQRDDLARRLATADDKDAAALHRQLTLVLDRLDKLPASSEVTPLDRIAAGVADELAKRRANRQSSAAGAHRARRGRPAGS